MPARPWGSGWWPAPPASARRCPRGRGRDPTRNGRRATAMADSVLLRGLAGLVGGVAMRDGRGDGRRARARGVDRRRRCRRVHSRLRPRPTSMIGDAELERLCHRGGISACSAITATPAASSAAVWPSPHTAPTSDDRQQAAALAHHRRHGGQVVDVERVAQPEHEAEAEDGERAGDVMTGHSHLPQRLDDDRDARERDDERARHRHVAGEAAVERQPCRTRPRAYTSIEADAGQHAGEPDAERDDQREPESDAMRRRSRPASRRAPTGRAAAHPRCRGRAGCAP